MLLFHAFLLPFLTLAFLGEDGSLARRLHKAQWKQRVVLVCSPSAQNSDFIQQQTWLTQSRDALAEREMLVLSYTAENLSPSDRATLQDAFHYAPNTFGVWLIGKDGGIKLSRDRPVTLQELCALVDAMPMRQAEIRRRTP
jgi:hypothetical protein